MPRTECSRAKHGRDRRLVGVDEIEDGQRPVAQRTAEAIPVTRPADRDRGAHVVEVFLAHPAQRQRRLTTRL